MALFDPFLDLREGEKLVQLVCGFGLDDSDNPVPGDVNVP
jgi:hypothetical protein